MLSSLRPRLPLLALLACMAAVPSLVASGAQASPALPIADVAGGPQLFEVFNALSGAGLSSSAELASWAGPDASGAWDGELWHGGMDSVVVAISTSAGNSNYFGIYRDTATGDGKLTLYGGLSGDEMLGPVFDARPLFHDETDVHDVGFWLTSTGLGGRNTFHGRSELDRGSSTGRAGSSFGHLASFHFGEDVTVHTGLGDLELRNAHLLAWEDWTDADYDDLVVLVGEVGATPVPEPGTGVLLAAGLALALTRTRDR